MIASLIATFLLVGVVIFFSGVGRESTKANVYLSLQQSSRTAISALRDDIETAVRITASTAARINADTSVTGLAGLTRVAIDDDKFVPAGPRDPNADYDIIRIFRFNYGDYRAEIEPNSIGINYGNDGQSGGFRLVPPATIGTVAGLTAEQVRINNNILAYVYKSIDKFNLFYVANTLGSNILSLAKPDTIPPNTYPVLYTALTDSGFDAGDFNDPRTTVTPLSEVIWFVNTAGQLIRYEDGRSTEFARNVNRFVVDFTFANRRADRSLPLTVPDILQLLSHPRDPKFIANNAQNEWGQSGSCPSGSDQCCNPQTQNCVEWQDIFQVYVDLSINEDVGENFMLTAGAAPVSQSSNPFQDAANTMGFTLQDGYLAYREVRNIQPFSANSSSEEIATQGQDISCTVNDPSCRCREDSTELFQNPIYGTPDWVGFGRYVGHPSGASAYCICGTNPGGYFIPPESSEGRAAVPNWTGNWVTPTGSNFVDGWNDPMNERIVACTRHFGGHQTYAWRSKFRLHELMNNGLINKFDFVSSTRNPDTGEFTWYPHKFDELYADYMNESSNNHNNWQDRVRCHLAEDYNDRSFRRMLHPKAETTVPGARGNDLAQPWVEKCACENVWRYRCYHNVGVGERLSQDYRCDSWGYGNSPDTSSDWDSEGRKIYRLGDSLSSVNNVALCHCFHDTFQQDPISTSHGHFYSFYWDFRQGIPPGERAVLYNNAPQFDEVLTPHQDGPGDYVVESPPACTINQAAGTYFYPSSPVCSAFTERYRNAGSWRPHEVTFSYLDEANNLQGPITRECLFGSFMTSCVDPSRTFANRFNDQAARVAAYATLLPQFVPEGFIGQNNQPGTWADPTTDLSTYCHPSCLNQRSYDPDDHLWGGNTAVQRRARMLKNIEVRLAITGAPDIESLPPQCSVLSPDGGSQGAF